MTPSIDKPVLREEIEVTLDPDLPEDFDPDLLDADGDGIPDSLEA